MSALFGVHHAVVDQHAARAALMALAGEDGATWILCDVSGQALVVGAGAGAALATTPGGEAAAWGLLAAAVQDPQARIVTLAPGFSAKLTRLSPRGEVLIQLIPPPAATLSEGQDLLRLTTRLSGDFWAIVELDGRVILLNDASRAFEFGVADPVGRVVWELVPTVTGERWAAWVAGLNHSALLRDDLELARPRAPHLPAPGGVCARHPGGAPGGAHHGPRYWPRLRAGSGAA